MRRRKGKFSIAGYVICSVMMHTLLFSLGFITIPKGKNNLLVDVEISGESGLPDMENYPQKPAEFTESMENPEQKFSPDPLLEPQTQPTEIPPEEIPLQNIMPADDPQLEEALREQIPSIEEIPPEDIKNYEEENSIKEKLPEQTPEEEKLPEPAPEEEKLPEPAPEEEKKPEPAPEEEKKPEPAPEEEKLPEPTPEEEKKPEPAPEEEKKPKPTPEKEKKPKPTPEKEKKPKPTPEKEKKPEPAPIKAKKPVEKVKKKRRKTIKDIVEKSVRDQSDREFDKMLGNSMTDLQKSRSKGQTGRGAGSFGSDGGVNESDSELIMSQIYPHWAVASGVKNAESIIIEINVELRDNGEVILSSIEILDQERYMNDSTFRAAADSAKRAILLASPLNIPKNKIDLLREITLRFNMKKALRR
ncbi:MAG: hypothetical protein LBB12_02860 [Holosporaceae bacterium]|jgi:hypothetical protein|nr:hypothetical protein [Holosporaceae bacterium]